MSATRDPHEVELDDMFPSTPIERRRDMRDFLDEYCEFALQVFERLERQRREDIDGTDADS
jgi:hypothetical protein